MRNNNETLKHIINSLIPVILAFALGAIIILFTGNNPLYAYWILLKKSLFTSKGFLDTLHYASPLILTGLAIAVTFKANVYNMGVEGQMLLGGFFSGLVGSSISVGNPFIEKFIFIIKYITINTIITMTKKAVILDLPNLLNIAISLIVGVATYPALLSLKTPVVKNSKTLTTP